MLRKIKKLIFSFFLVLIVLLFSPQVTRAQENTYDCAWSNGKCSVISRCNEKEGYHPDSENCEGLNQPACERIRKGLKCSRECALASAPCNENVPCCKGVCGADGYCSSQEGTACAPPGGSCASRTCCMPDLYECRADVCVNSALPDTGTSENPTCNNDTGIDTAIGCIPIQNTNEFVGFFLRWALGIGGGIAFLLILYAGFIITTSSGDPKKLQAGKELMTSAVAGLMLLIFAIFILQFIGVQILDIPWFK